MQKLFHIETVIRDSFKGSLKAFYNRRNGEKPKYSKSLRLELASVSGCEGSGNEQLLIPFSEDKSEKESHKQPKIQPIPILHRV